MKCGVILPLSNGPDEPDVPYKAIREMALTVESSGLDSAWVYDHLIYRFPDQAQFGVQEAWTVLTGLAEATSRIELGCLVFCVPFRNPALLAKMAVTLDEVSEGRLILGLGAGWHQPEFDAFGYSMSHLVDQFEEALKIIVPLIREGKVDFTGEYFSAPNCELLPPPKAGGIPILIAGAKPRMLSLTATYADAWNTAWHGNVETSAERRELLKTACETAGREPDTLEVTVGLMTAFPALMDASEEIDREKTIAGTPAEVATELRRYREAGVGHVICQVQPGTPAGVEQLAEAWSLANG